MPKKRNGIMTVRIPKDEKDALQDIADAFDQTLSDVVVKAVRNFIEANAGSLKKGASKSKSRSA
jgi:predicted transcriptional regulator